MRIKNLGGKSLSIVEDKLRERASLYQYEAPHRGKKLGRGTNGVELFTELGSEVIEHGQSDDLHKAKAVRERLIK